MTPFRFGRMAKHTRRNLVRCGFPRDNNPSRQVKQLAEGQKSMNVKRFRHSAPLRQPVELAQGGLFPE